MEQSEPGTISMLVAVIICGIALAGIGLVVLFGTAETDEARSSGTWQGAN